MARDVAGYLSEVKTLAGRAQASIDTLIYEFLNDLFEKVQTDPEKLWFLDKTVRFTVSASDAGATGAIIQVPADFGDEYSLFIVKSGEFVEVKSIAADEAKRKYGPSDSGEPERFSIEGKSFRLWPPVPDATYTLELSYKMNLTRVSITTDTNDFMENYHSMLIDGLRAKVFEYLGMEERAQYYWNKWDRAWADLRAYNVQRVLSGEVRFEPKTDADAPLDQERGNAGSVQWG